MIPVKDGLTQIDELPGEEIQFGIGDPRWVMRSNAKLYSDITTAIIREYSTNAHDANVMAGNKSPIRVTLPSMMNPFFTVEDDGVGMDIEDFREIYTQFGTSNKRESNDTNGTLGFGSKSGVAYTTQFTVTSVKNGTKIHGVVMRKPDWSIVLKVVSTVKTDEGNGTKIQIPVHNVEQFVAKATEFYKFWLPGRVLVNGKAPQHFVGDKIVEGLYYSQNWNTSYIVMGNVPYRINNPSALFRSTTISQFNFVAYVDNGDVEFTPSREDLEYTEHTTKTLQKIVNEFEAKILDVAKSEIAAATTHAEAYKAWTKWTDRLGKELFADLEFKGDKFVSDFKVKGKRYYRNAYRGNTLMSIDKWNVESMDKTIVVTEFDIEVSSRHKQMVKQYAEQQGWSFTYALFTTAAAGDIVCPWITKDMFVDYETMKAATKLAPKPRSSANYYNPNAGRVKGSWDYYTSKGGETEKPIPNIEDGGHLFYIDVQSDKVFNPCEILKRIGDDKSVVIVVPANRLPKFLRENPKAEAFIPYARTKVIKDGTTLLNVDAKRMLEVDNTTQYWINRLDMSKVDDKELHETKTLLSRSDELLAAYKNNITLANWLKMGYGVVKEYSPDTSAASIYKKYPLLEKFRYDRVSADIYIYMNAKNALEKENKNGK